MNDLILTCCMALTPPLVNVEEF